MLSVTMSGKKASAPVATLPWKSWGMSRMSDSASPSARFRMSRFQLMQL